MAAVIFCIITFPQSSSQEERPKEAAVASGVPSGPGWDSGGPGRGTLPIPLPPCCSSALFSCWSMGARAQRCPSALSHRADEFGWARTLFEIKASWFLRERRGSKSFSDVAETPGWVGMCAPKLLCHCLLANTANISGAQQAAF